MFCPILPHKDLTPGMENLPQEPKQTQVKCSLSSPPLHLSFLKFMNRQKRLRGVDQNGHEKSRNSSL